MRLQCFVDYELCRQCVFDVLKKLLHVFLVMRDTAGGEGGSVAGISDHNHNVSSRVHVLDGELEDEFV